MATVNVKISVCDKCGNDAETWHFTPPGGQRVPVDLCEEHASTLTLRDLEQLTADVAAGHGAARVKTAEQIEREKKAAKRVAAKRARGS